MAGDAPDHVWEPQTTRAAIALSRGASNVIVGGRRRTPPTRTHAPCIRHGARRPAPRAAETNSIGIGVGRIARMLETRWRLDAARVDKIERMAALDAERVAKIERLQALHAEREAPAAHGLLGRCCAARQPYCLV